MVWRGSCGKCVWGFRGKQKAVREGRPFAGGKGLSFGGLLRAGGFSASGGYLGLDGGLLALNVGLAACFVFGFVILFSHNGLYFRRKLRFGVWYYEFLQTEIQSLFTGRGVVTGKFRMLDVSS